MHAQINAAQAKALAHLVHTLNPAWDVPGIAAAISKARHRAPAHELAIAAVRLSTRTDLASPAVLAQDGPHWRAAPSENRDDHRFDRCPEPGHASYPAWACGACRAEQIGAEEHVSIEPVVDREEYARGAALARAALTQGGKTE